MDKARLQTARRRLEALAARMRPEVEAITEQVLSPSSGQGTTELSNAPMHLGDSGTDENLHDLNAAYLENEGYLLSEINAALERLDSGTYGNCEDCGRPIAAARLQAMPFARQCVRCAKVSDDTPQANLNTGRPRGPDDTLADEEEMEIKRRDKRANLGDIVSPTAAHGARGDTHAAGTPGGGAAIGGLAGTTKGDGSPDIHDLQEAMGSGNYEFTEGDAENGGAPTADIGGSAASRMPVSKSRRSEMPETD